MHPMKGRNRCKYHGGASPRGIGHYNYKGKGFSRDLPTRLVDRFNEQLNDAELSSLRHHLALIDVRIGETLGKLDTGEATERWEQARLRVTEIRKALEESEHEKALTIAEQLEDLVRRSQADDFVWAAVQDLIAQRRKLADTEGRREAALRDSLKVDQAMAFVSTVTAILREEVQDQKVLTKIGLRLSETMQREQLPQLGAGDDIVDAEFEEVDDAPDA